MTLPRTASIAPRHGGTVLPLLAIAARAALLCLALLCVAAPASPAGAAAHGDDTRAQIRLAVEDATTADAGARDPDALRRLYEPGDYAPLWLDAHGRPSADAADALALLAQAAGEGLDAADYRVAELVRRRPGPGAAALPAARWDVDLSRSVLRYLAHLHWGRVDPRDVGWRLPARHGDTHDLAQALREAVLAHRLPVFAAGAAPVPAQYRLLREALARYRSIAADAAFAEPLAPPARGVRRGQVYPALDTLRRRLVALGDLPPAALLAPPTAPMLYDGAVVDAVMRFQERHGLQVDGVLGKATVSALNVPPAQRVRQIELAMERLRWLPHLSERRTVAINIPMFRLWAWDPAAGPAARPLNMGVIVGRALDTQTPVLVEQMRYVIFRPYWNVPRSIVLNEILPALARQPSYLQRNGMEIVRGASDEAVAVPPTRDHIELLRQGVLRLRQRPGPGNSLGLVKFVFPNDEAVYLHGTPAQALFARARRDFSHGCVRLEDPVAMAEWVLKDLPPWNRERILAAMNGDRPVRVDLPQPVQVILYYTTALVMPGGAVHFAQDIYRHDQRLEQALQQGRAS